MKKVILSVVAALALAGLFTTTAVAGRDPRPAKAIDTIGANMYHTYKESFEGGKIALVSVKGDKGTDLDLYIYDDNGVEVAKDDDNTDQCLVIFTPKANAKYTIKVINRSATKSNTYNLLTN